MVKVLEHSETFVKNAYHHSRHILHCYICRERGRHEAAWLCALSHSLPIWGDKAEECFILSAGWSFFPLNYSYRIAKKFLWVQTFAIFTDWSASTKIKTAKKVWTACYTIKCQRSRKRHSKAVKVEQRWCSTSRFLTHSYSPDTLVNPSHTRKTQPLVHKLASLLSCFFSLPGSHVGWGHQLVGMWSECHTYVANKLKPHKFLLKGLEAFPQNIAALKISCYTVYVTGLVTYNTTPCKYCMLLLVFTGG